MTNYEIILLISGIIAWLIVLELTLSPRFEYYQSINDSDLDNPIKDNLLLWYNDITAIKQSKLSGYRARKSVKIF